MAATWSIAAEQPLPLSAREVVERSRGAVVRIDAGREDRTRQGSGFVVESGGAIVTSLHVVDNATQVTISLLDGTTLDELAVRAFDVENDLVVLVADLPSGMTALSKVSLGDTALIEPGDRILVIGNPLGLEQTVTEGIVSAWRESDEEEPTQMLMLPPRLLQISATIAPGSSGGPVFNELGEVIGVAKAGVLHGAAGINFAVPVDGLPALLDEDEEMDLETFQKRVDHVRFGLARPHFESAEFAYERDDHKEAHRHLERALLRFPKYVEALLLAGRLAREEGRFELAEQRLTDAVIADADNAEAWYQIGRLYEAMAADLGSASLHTRAAGAYEKAVDLEYRHAQAAFRLAVIRFGQGDSDRAEQLLLAAIDSEPGLSDAHYVLGEVYLARRSTESAKEAFERALWEDQEHALSHFGLAKLHMLLDLAQHGIVLPQATSLHHWEEFLRLSEGDPSLAEQREFAIRVASDYFPHLLDR